MDCPNCGAGAAGNFCANCGGALPGPVELDAEVVEAALETSAEAELVQAEASATYAEAELERATHATDEDVDVVEAEAAETAALANADVAGTAIETLGEVATAAIDALAENAEHEERQEDAEHDADDDAGRVPPQPEDDAGGGQHVEPISLLAPQPARTATTTRRGNAWRRHRR